MSEYSPDDEEISRHYEEILEMAGQGKYYLNPDREFVDDLVRGLLVNKERYGYEACPCRLTIGSEEENRDIMCPCDYRDDDLVEYGCCYCGLYVSEEISRGEKDVIPIPERRDLKNRGKNAAAGDPGTGKLAYPVYRCNVCGYLCARNNPPERCPVCGADSKRFQVFMR